MHRIHSRRRLAVELLRYRLKSLLPWIGVLAAGLLASGLGLWARLHLNSDLQGAQQQRATGSITAVHYSPPIRDGIYRLDLLEIDGTSLQLRAAPLVPAVPLRQRERVSYVYRIGKSGAWYLDHVERLPRGAR